MSRGTNLALWAIVVVVASLACGWLAPFESLTSREKIAVTIYGFGCAIAACAFRDALAQEEPDHD